MGKTKTHNPFLTETKKEENKSPRKNQLEKQEGARTSQEQDQADEPTAAQIQEEQLHNPLIY